MAQPDEEARGPGAADLAERGAARTAEEALVESEAAFRYLADAVPQLVWIADPDGNIDYYSKQAERYDGLHRRQDGTWEWAPVLHPDDVERTAEAWRRAVATGEPYEVEHRVRIADGSYRWHVSRALPARDARGRVTRWYGTATDIQRLKEAQEALHRSRTMLQSVLDHIPQGVFWKDRDGRFLGTNVVAARATGFERPEDVVGLTDYDLPGVTPEQAAFFQGKDREVMESGEPALGIQEPLGHPDGTTSWLHTNKVPLRDGDGRVVGVLGTWEDVTERRRTEQALRRSEERYRTLFASMDQGYCVLELIFDGDGVPVDYRFIEANPAFEEQTGLVDAVGRTARELVPGLEDYWVETYGRVAATGEPERFELGSEAMGRWFDVYASRVGGAESRQVALLFTDITERKGTEEARAESERRYRALFKQAPAFIAVLRGPEHVFEFVNPAYLRLVGERDLLGKPVREALPELEGQNFFEMLDRAYGEGETLTAVDRPVVLQRGEVGAAEQRFVDFVYEPLRESDGAVSGVIALGVDTTDRVRAREALARTHQELEARVAVRTRQVRELSRALTLAEQRERQRIAHILHDDLQQILFGANVAHSLGDTERLQAVLGEAMELTRQLSHDLSPPLLHGEDLEDLLRWIAEQARDRYGLEVEVEVGGGVPVPDTALRILLYQLVRELLFNVAKHAGTGAARVVAARAERAEGLLRIVVVDEGRGFDPAMLERSVGMGLRSVRERLDLVGGRIEMVSGPGQGTRATLEIPTGPEQA